LKLVRVVAPHFVAGFETDGVVRRTAPILKALRGFTDDAARVLIRGRGWKASIVEEYDEVHSDDQRPRSR
jgi:hypothetical protein